MVVSPLTSQIKYCWDITQEGLSKISLGRQQAANTGTPLAFNDLFLFFFFFQNELKVGSTQSTIPIVQVQIFLGFRSWVRNILSPFSLQPRAKKETREVRISNDGNHFLVGGVRRGHKNPVWFAIWLCRSRAYYNFKAAPVI